MKKLIIKIFNLVYIAGCVVAMLGFLTKPLISVGVSASVPVSEIVKLISDGGSETEQTTKSTIKNDLAGSVSDFISEEKLAAEGITSLDIEATIEIAPKNIGTYLDTKNNYLIIKEGLYNSIDNFVDGTLDYFKNLTLAIAKIVASSTLVEQIKEIGSFSGEIETLFEEYHCEEMVEDIVSTVVEKFEEGNVSISDLASTLMGEKNEEGEYDSGIKGIISILEQDENFQIDGEIENLSQEDLEEVITSAFESIPGLTEDQYAEASPQPTGLISASETKYYVFENGEYVEVVTTSPEETFSSSKVYLVKNIIITDFSTVITTLLDLIPGGENTEGGEKEDKTEEDIGKSIIRAAEPTASETSDAELKEKIKNLIFEKLPIRLDRIDYSLKGYMPYILLGLIALGIFPWLLFLLVSVIRTIRKKKCWTKPWIVIVLASFQLILGIVLTVAVKFAPQIVGKFAGNALGDYSWVLDSVSLNLKTAAFLPSIIYIIVLPLTVAYVIVCHGYKKQYKQEKRDAKRAKKNGGQAESISAQ